MRFVMHKFNKDNPLYEHEKGYMEHKKEFDEHNDKKKLKLEIVDYEDSSNKKNYIFEQTIDIKPNSLNYENLDFVGKDIFLNEEQRKNLLKVLYSNYIKLGKYANKFEDNFIKNLVESTINEKNNNDRIFCDLNEYITKKEIIKYIENNKQDILFEMFYDYDIFNDNPKEKKQKSLSRFLMSHLLSEMGNTLLKFFDPDYSVTNPIMKDFINQLKAINYLIYNIEKEDYPRAFACFNNIHPKNLLINKLKKNIEVMAKNQIFCDIVENHIDASQLYREQNKYDDYKM